MSLRDGLGTAVAQVHERVDSLLDSEDAMIVLVDDARAISYAHGFGLSPSQLELLALEVERAVRRIAGPSQGNRNGSRTCGGYYRDSRRGSTMSRRLGSVHELDRHRGDGGDRLRTRGPGDGGNRRSVGRLLRLATETPQAESV